MKVDSQMKRTNHITKQKIAPKRSKTYVLKWKIVRSPQKVKIDGELVTETQTTYNVMKRLVV